MTTPTQLQQLARELANEICRHVPLVWQNYDKYYEIALSALEQVSREERKEAQALATALEFYAPWASGEQARVALAAWKEKA